MAQAAIRGGSIMERKIISVSVKRQITIPQKYFEALGFGNEAECVMQDNYLLIRPVRDSGNSEFSEQILEDLISQGFQGQELLEKFKQQSKQIRPAVEKLIAEADALAQSGAGKIPINDLLGTED